MADSEIETPRSLIAIIVLIFGSVFVLSAFISYQILHTLEWVSWSGVLACLGIFLVGLVLLVVGWIWWRVLRR